MKSRIAHSGTMNIDIGTKLETVAFTVAKIALFAMMVLITVSTTGRYLIDQPLPDINLISSIYLLVGAIFLSAPRMQLEGGNISVEILARRMSDRGKRISDFIAYVLTLGVFVIIAQKAATIAVEKWAGNATSGTLSLPTYLSWSLMFIGSLGLCLVLVYHTGKLFMGLLSSPKENSASGNEGEP